MTDAECAEWIRAFMRGDRETLDRIDPPAPRPTVIVDADGEPEALYLPLTKPLAAVLKIQREIVDSEPDETVEAPPLVYRS